MDCRKQQGYTWSQSTYISHRSMQSGNLQSQVRGWTGNSPGHLGSCAHNLLCEWGEGLELWAVYYTLWVASIMVYLLHYWYWSWYIIHSLLISNTINKSMNHFVIWFKLHELGSFLLWQFTTESSQVWVQSVHEYHFFVLFYFLHIGYWLVLLFFFQFCIACSNILNQSIQSDVIQI